MGKSYIIEAENLSKRYSECIAVNNISFRVRQGEIVGLLGPNGAGKSSIMRILAAFQPATTGAVRVAGRDVFYEFQAAQQAVGYMPENNPLPLEMRVREYLQFRAKLKRIPREKRRRVDEVIQACGLAEVQKRIIGRLSRGYRQRIGLADALVHDPSLLILDEPTAGLDPNQIRTVRKLIKSLAPRTTVLLSTHILSEVSLICSRIIIIHQGKILADESAKSLRARFSEFLEIHAEIAGPHQEIQQALQQIPEVEETSMQELAPPFSRFVLRVQSQRDIRAEVFKLACQRSWPLRELRRREYSLEEIFSRFTEQSATE